MNRTSVALAEETIFWKIVVNVPANTSHTVRCYMNKQEVWKSENIGHHYHGTKTTTFLANVTMNDWNLNSEDFYFQYMDEKVYGVVLVRGELGKCVFIFVASLQFPFSNMSSLKI